MTQVVMRLESVGRNLDVSSKAQKVSCFLCCLSCMPLVLGIDSSPKDSFLL